KTQSIEFHENIIDTPGEYVENRRYYPALQVTSVEADAVALVMDCQDENSSFPPGFATMFNKPVIGIITKTDLFEKDDFQIAEKLLRLSGAGKVFKVSALKNQGVDNLVAYIHSVE